MMPYGPPGPGNNNWYPDGGNGSGTNWGPGYPMDNAPGDRSGMDINMPGTSSGPWPGANNGQGYGGTSGNGYVGLMGPMFGPMPNYYPGYMPGAPGGNQWPHYPS